MLLAAIPQVFKGIAGGVQMFSGARDLRHLHRPTYEIPKEMGRATGIAAAAYADPRMPGEDFARQNIDLSASSALNAAAESGTPGLITAIQANRDQSSGALAAQSAQYQQSDADRYRDALGRMAEYRDQAWQMNKFAPYVDKYNEARQKLGGGAQNLYGALDGLGSIAMMHMAGAAPIPSMQQRAGDATSRSMFNDAATGSINNSMGLITNKRPNSDDILSQLYTQW